jgi:hypothetical protein
VMAWVARNGACEVRSRREEEAMRTSATTSNDELTRNPLAPSGFRRRADICGVATPGQGPTLPASRRLASAGTALGTRPMPLLGQAPSESAKAGQNTTT